MTGTATGPIGWCRALSARRSARWAGYLAALSILLLVDMAQSARAQGAAADASLQEALQGALRGCESWVLDPASWIENERSFLERIGLGDRVSEIDRVPDELLPPPEFRVSNRYWRIRAGDGDGFVLIVSRDIPICHIAGAGRADYQSMARSFVADPQFLERWRPYRTEGEVEHVTEYFRLREDESFTLVFSRAAMPGARRDRPQVLLTAFYETDG